MTPPEKRKRMSISTPSQQQQQQHQQHPLVALTPPLVPYHPPMNGHPHMVPMVPYAMCHPHAHPHYYIPVPSPTNALGVVSPGPTTSPRYERILPKRPSDASSSTTSPSLQPSPLSLPQHHHPIPSLFPLPPATTTADQREQARKVSHSAIERRRRERINDKILQLKQIIPHCADQENLHKLSILQSAIDYIIYLKKQAQQHDVDPSSSSSSSSHPLDEEEEEKNPPATPDGLPVVLEPLKPIDIMKNTSTPFQHSSPPCRPSDSPPTLSLEKNSHMKLDNLLS